MAKNISTLNIGLDATVAPLVNGLKRAESAVGGFASKITSIGGTLAGLTGIGAVVGGIVGSISFGVLINSQMEAIDSTAKLSDRIGIATEQLDRVAARRPA